MAPSGAGSWGVEREIHLLPTKLFIQADQPFGGRRGQRHGGSKLALHDFNQRKDAIDAPYRNRVVG